MGTSRCSRRWRSSGRSERIARPNHRAPHMGNRGIVESQTFLRLSEVSADDVFEIVEVDHDVRVEGIDVWHEARLQKLAIAGARRDLSRRLVRSSEMGSRG